MFLKVLNELFVSSILGAVRSKHVFPNGEVILEMILEALADWD